VKGRAHRGRASISHLRVRSNQARAVPREYVVEQSASTQDYLGEPVTEAVITVPAYFNDSQKLP